MILYYLIIGYLKLKIIFIVSEILDIKLNIFLIKIFLD